MPNDRLSYGIDVLFFRQLSMMLMLAQSNPQLFALIGTKSNINKELERIEQFSKLQQLTTSDLVNRNKKNWKNWLQNYRWVYLHSLCLVAPPPFCWDIFINQLIKI